MTERRYASTSHLMEIDMFLEKSWAHWLLLAALPLTLAVGCADDGTTYDSESAPVDDPVLVPEEVVKAGWPGNDALPMDYKSDQELPTQFGDVVALQSPVKSQGSRGVCSIFSTAAYMEHLYIAEGTITDPDFSEQYLQWSAKVQVGSFPRSSGSNAGSNLRAISDYGIPVEAAWPYEKKPWSGANDEACGGEDDDDLPTRCHTNGDPPQEALDAEKFFLPESKWLSTRPESIKSHIYNKKQGVIVGLTFFYQSWNHRRSKLPTNSDYWDKGYVLAPNDEDREISLQKRAGHSILLVGWDDELEVPRVDGKGEIIVDADGNPVTEKGFFIFKNSWGTGSFGAKNPHGDGYGFISYEYVKEFGSGRISDLPELAKVEEICGDEIDNDDNGTIDCADSACADAPLCASSTEIIEVELPDGGLAIPDNDFNGVELPFEVSGGGEVKGLNLKVDITHAFRGDISIRLIAPDGTSIVVKMNNSDSDDDIVETYVVNDARGLDSIGQWSIVVADHSAVDTGTINSLTVEMAR